MNSIVGAGGGVLNHCFQFFLQRPSYQTGQLRIQMWQNPDFPPEIPKMFLVLGGLRLQMVSFLSWGRFS